MTTKNHLNGQKYKAQLEASAESLPGADINWIAALRYDAMAEFIDTGLPGPKVEAWKYTNLSPLARGEYDLLISPTGTSDGLSPFKNNNGSEVVFTDGFYDKENSTNVKQDGVMLISLNDYMRNDPAAAQKLFSNKTILDSLQSLNIAMMTGGYVLIVDENVKLAEPIHIVHNTTASSVDKGLRTRCFIDVKKNASAQLFEIFTGENDQNYWRHHVTEAIVAEDAELEIYQIQQEGDQAIHTADTLVDVSTRANFKHYSLNIGGKISRSEIKPTLTGLNANTDLRGAFLGRNGNSHDVFTHMKHMKPEGTSDQIYRGVLDNGGKSAFQGKVYVAKDAQLTNADQSNKNLLLDRNAEANSKPELLIYADDVKCSHGATVGELDAEALFYLNSRGLDQTAAKSLLVEAFVAEVFEDISFEPVRIKYLELARAWLNGDA